MGSSAKPGWLTGMSKGGRTRAIMNSIRLLLVFSMVLWNIGPSVAVAVDELTPATTPAAEQPATNEPAVSTQAPPETTTTVTAATEQPLTDMGVTPVETTAVAQNLLITPEATTETPAPAQAISLTPAVTTDKPDYAPGETVIISGTGFAPGEPVLVFITNAAGATVFDRIVDTDDAGAFLALYAVPLDGSASSLYSLIAAGQTSGAITTMTFTDCNATIKGYKYIDVDGDGDPHDSHPGCGGVTIELHKTSNNNLIKTTTTTDNGSYTFSSVSADSYYIKEVTPSSWTRLYPTDNNGTYPITVHTSDDGKTLSGGNFFNAQADLGVTKTDAPDPVTPGGTLTYTITITNYGPCQAKNVSLADTAPLQLTSSSVQYSIDNGNHWNSWSSPLTLGDIANGGSQTVLIKGTVKSDATGTISNTATVSSTISEPNPDPHSNTATCTTAVPQADLSVTKTDGKDSIHAGASDTYTITVKNNGPDTAKGVSLADTSPLAGTQYNFDNGSTWTAWTTPLSLGDMTSGQVKTVYLKGTAPSSGNSFSNTAVVSTTTHENTLTNNTATDPTNLQYLVTFDETGLPSSSSYKVKVNGTDHTVTAVSGVDYQEWVNAGSTVIYSYQDPVTGSDTYLYSFTTSTPASGFTVNSNKDVVGTYVRSVGNISGLKWVDKNGDGHRDHHTHDGHTVYDDPPYSGANCVIYVDLDNDNERDSNEPSATTGADGTYTITGVPVGTNYSVREEGPAGYTPTYPNSSGEQTGVSVTCGQTTCGVDFGNFEHFIKTFKLEINPPIDGLTYFVKYTTDSWSHTTELALARDGSTDYFKATAEFETAVNLQWKWVAKKGASIVWTSDNHGPESLHEVQTNSGDLDYDVDLSSSATNKVGDPHTFTVTVKDHDDNNALAGVTVYLSTTFGTISANSVTTNSNGQATFTVLSNAAGHTHVTAWIDESGGTGGTYNDGEEHDTATKTWEDVRIRIVPPDDTNPIKTNHTFTVYLEKTVDGDNWTSAGHDKKIDLTYTGTGAVVSVNNNSPPSPLHGHTNGSGVVTVVAYSELPGPGLLTANFNGEVDEIDFDRTGTSQKTWIDYKITVTQVTNENPINTDHTFTVLLEENDGEGWFAVANKLVDLVYAGVGSLVTINGNDAGPGPYSGTTDVNGNIIVVAHSNNAGTGTLTATFNTNIGQGEHALTRTDSAVKTWFDYRLTITPPDATNRVNEDHVFTVKLEMNDGTWAPAAGQTVDVALTGHGAITDIGENTPPPYSGITAADGTFTVTAESGGTRGLGTLTATYDTEIGGIEFSTQAATTKLWTAGTVTGQKWNDLNGDGNKGPANVEPRLEGWKITLTEVAVEGGYTDTATTDVNGDYTFANVPPGEYLVTEDMTGKDGWTKIYPLGEGHTITVVDDQTTTDVDFGNKAIGTIGGTVFNDLPPVNGILDAGEPRLVGWTVTLFGADGTTVLDTMLSGADGGYLFDNLLPGTYWVSETLGGPQWSNTTPLKRKVELIFTNGEIFNVIADFGNENPSLGFHAGNQILPYTGGLYHSSPVVVTTNGGTHKTSSPPLHGSFDGLLVAALGALAAASLTVVVRRRNRHVERTEVNIYTHEN
jgi:uncharacterized repeat protein (TIGR01451 family)